MATREKAIAAARVMDLTNWTGPRQVLVLILVLAIPVAITNLLQAFIGFVDVRMLSGLGKEALASLTVGRTSFWLMSSIFMGLGAGITAYVARFTGAKDEKRAKAYAAIGILTASAIGLVIMTLGLVFGAEPVKFMVTSDEVGVIAKSQELTRTYAWDYMQVVFISMIGLGIQFAAVSVFNSLGRTMYPMWLLVISNFANFLGNWFLIPRYQVAGCAWSTTITTLISSAVAVYWLSRQGSVAWSRELFVKPLRRAWEMLKLGLPATLQVMLRSLAMLTIIKLITFLPNSVTGQSAFVVGLMAESLAFMPAFAFSIAAATLVGQNLGAEKPEQARLGTLYCMGFSQIIMVVMGVLFLLVPGWFIFMFIGNNAADVSAPAADFLRIMAFCLPGLAVGMTMNGALRGSGDTKAAALITLTGMWIVRMPLIVFLTFDDILGTGLGLDWGLNGIWWGMTISVYVEALLAYLRFRNGAWSRIKLAVH